MRWLALMSIALVLSGCAVKDPEASGTPSPSSTPSGGTGSSSTSTPGTTGTTSSTGSTTGAPTTAQRPPMAALRASPANGTAPLNVTFAVTVSDPDGDALNWTLSFGDGNRTAGTRSGNVTHVFAGGGTFTATLSATDGRANATATAQVAVQAGAAPGAPSLNPACQRPDAVPVGGHYVDERGGPLGGGTWIYEETNDIPGLQLSQEPSLAGDVDPLATANNCVDGDTVVF